METGICRYQRTVNYFEELFLIRAHVAHTETRQMHNKVGAEEFLRSHALQLHYT